MSRSNSANTASSAAIARPAGVVRSKGFGHRDESHTKMLEFLQSCQQVRYRSAPTIQPPHEHYVDLPAARRREIDVVLVWRLDRWGRSVADLLATLQELEHLGVGFVSVTE